MICPNSSNCTSQTPSVLGNKRKQNLHIFFVGTDHLGKILVVFLFVVFPCLDTDSQPIPL